MNKKKAFTLAEVLLVMLMIGILSIIGLNIFKSNDKGIRYIYSNAFHSLDRAFYNSVNYTSLDDPFAAADSPKELDEQNPHRLSQYGEDNEAGMQAERVRRMCNMLIEYIDTTYTNCGAITANPNGNSFGTPSFIAANGARFYISQMLPEGIKQDNGGLILSKGEPLGAGYHSFFLIFADLNGEKEPNSMFYNLGHSDKNAVNHTEEELASSRCSAGSMYYYPECSSSRMVDPDIFAFAALDIGRMCPLGPPEVDTKFMLTRIMYHDASNVSSNLKSFFANVYNDISKNLKLWFVNQKQEIAKIKYNLPRHMFGAAVAAGVKIEGGLSEEVDLEQPQQQQVLNNAAEDEQPIIPIPQDPQEPQGTNNFNDASVAIKFSTVPKPYYVSKAEAWGYYIQNVPSSGAEQAMSQYYPVSDDAIMVDDNPYMYNGYVKKILEDTGYENSMIYSFLGKDSNGKNKGLPRADTDYLNRSTDIHLMSGEIQNHEYKCHAGSDEECDVIIEKYIY